MTNQNSRIFRLLVVVLLFQVFAAVAALRVCSSCGYEVAGDASSCGHCGAAVAAAPAAQPSGDGAEAAPGEASGKTTDWPIPGEVVDLEIRTAMELMRGGDADVGAMFLANAAALNSLSGGDGGAARTKKMAELMAVSGGGGGTTMIKCTTCDGTGKRMMKVTSLTSGSVEMKEAYGMYCQTCRGSGKVARASTISEQKFAYSRTVKRFGDMQKTRKMEQVGGAWLPVGILTGLKPSQVATLRKHTAAPCEACIGFGREDCKLCLGAGLVKCEVTGCIDGKVTTVIQGTLAKGELKRSEPCKKCRGSGKQACAACLGRGSVPCSKCGGTGERPVCKKCGGQGYSQCQSCGGQGTTEKGPCSKCGGSGENTCTTCSGDGRQ